MVSSLRQRFSIGKLSFPCLMFAAGLFWQQAVAWADTLEQALAKPTGEVLLRISGDLTLPNAGDEAHFDLAILESFPVTHFSTHTPWSDGIQKFSGVRINDLLKAVGAQTNDFTAIALDDYKFSVSDLDINRYPVIVAHRVDDKPISVRQLGPLRIMFPFDDFPELRTLKNESSAVWQLLEMTLP